MTGLCYLLPQLFKSAKCFLSIHRILSVLQILVQSIVYQKIQSQKRFAHNFPVYKHQAIQMKKCNPMQSVWPII